MKILMIASGYYPECCGGVEVITQAISEGLVQDGHIVTVLCSSDTPKRYIHNGVHVIKIAPLVLTAGPKLLKNRINRLLQMYNPFQTEMFCRLYKEEKPDVIHLHMARMLSMSVLTAAQKCGIPVVSTLHEYFSLWNFDPFHRMEDIVDSKPQFYVELVRHMHRKVTAKVQWVTSPMEKTFHIYQEEGYYDGCKYSYVNNALPMMDRHELEVFEKERIDRKPHSFLLICRLMPFKGIEKTLNIFLNNSELDQWELHIAGDGPLRSQVLEACKAKSNIFYHGFVIDKDKEYLFQMCDCLWFMTDELETYGLVVAEAFQHGMPVMTSDVEAMHKLVVDDYNGIIIKKFDDDNINEALHKLSNPEYYGNLVKNICLMDWEKPYNKMIMEYEKIYTSVI